MKVLVHPRAREAGLKCDSESHFEGSPTRTREAAVVMMTTVAEDGSPTRTREAGGKTSILDIEVSKPYITKARFVLRNSPMVEGERYPRRCLDVMNGLISLTEAYELAQQDFKDREKNA